VQVPTYPSGITSFEVLTSSNGALAQTSSVDVANGAVSVNVPGYGVVSLYGKGTGDPSLAPGDDDPMPLPGTGGSSTGGDPSDTGGASGAGATAGTGNASAGGTTGDGSGNAPGFGGWSDDDSLFAEYGGSQGGCGCRVVSHRQRGLGSLLLLALGVLGAARGRRRRGVNEL
jgi:hypothetical protein